MIELGAGAVDVTLLDLDAVGDDDDARWEPLMSDDERARHRRFIYPRHRRQFLATRALCRCRLSAYAAVAARDWRFVANQHGCPAIDGADAAWLRFNLSNTDGLIALAVSRARDVGVDVENITRKVELGVADRFFSAAEVTALRRLDESQQRDRFFDYWTLKESYIKARRMGLAISLGAFGFDLDGAAPRIAIDAELGDDAAGWRFWLERVGARHRLAVAAHAGADDNPLTMRVTWLAPGDIVG